MGHHSTALWGVRSGEMDVLALGISAIAAAANGVSVWYTRRQAHAVEGALGKSMV
jgi:hypothetical protein